MKPVIKIFNSPEELGAGFAKEFVSVVSEYSARGENINVAFSGGNTPKLFFKSLAADYKNKIDWNYVYIYWADERCVSPDDNESNYKMTKEYLLDKVTINSNNINRIKGEANPAEEARRYSGIVKARLPEVNGLPRFDIILLGLGGDGHTASIFQGQLGLFETGLIYSESENPFSGQKRVTITGKVINNAKRVYFVVSGQDKSEVFKNVTERRAGADSLPAYHVQPAVGSLNWFIDKYAAGNL